MDNLNMFLEYLEVIKKYSENTINSYRIDIEELLEFTTNKKINYINITKKEVNSYLEYLYNKNIDKNTISRKLSSLRSFYNYLLNKEIIFYNYFNLIHNPRHQVKLPNYLKEEELDKMFSVPDIESPLGVRNRLILEILYATGVRVSELVNIKISDINFDNRTIKILGKGNKERMVVYGNHCNEILELYLNSYRKELLKNKSNEYLLLNKNGNQITTRMIRNILDDIILKCSLDKHVYPHMIRHSFATAMLNNGADIISVKELLGHESVNTTTIYTHVTNERLKEVYNNAHPRAKE